MTSLQTLEIDLVKKKKKYRSQRRPAGQEGWAEGKELTLGATLASWARKQALLGNETGVEKWSVFISPEKRREA